MRTLLVPLSIATLVSAACQTGPETLRDRRDDSFLAGGKADGPISEGTPEALGVLEVVNTTPRAALVAEAPDGVGLAEDAADGITAVRAGDDGEVGTDDDVVFDSLAQLDAIDFVGPIAFEKLLVYAEANDLVPVCGDGVLQVEEQCDDGNLEPGDGCDATCRFEPTAFRITSIELLDPHPFAKVLFFCEDGLSRLNDRMAETLAADSDGDGILDLSALAVFRPLDPAAEATGLEVAVGECTAPASSTSCTPDPEGPGVATLAHNANEGTCLDVLPGTTGDYDGDIALPQGPCFSSESITLTVPVGGFDVTLSDAQFAATYGEDDTLTTGLIRGFISEADADEIIVPDDIPIVGGKPLSRFLPGGDGSCADHDDRDTGPDGELGWYFYLAFTAEAVPFSE